MSLYGSRTNNPCGTRVATSPNKSLAVYFAYENWEEHYKDEEFNRNFGNYHVDNRSIYFCGAGDDGKSAGAGTDA